MKKGKWKMRRLFVCERPYPLYRTLMKCVGDCVHENDIVISNHVEGMEKIYPVLKETDLFKNVFFFDDVMYKEFFAYGSEREFFEFPQNIFRLLKKLGMYMKLQRRAAHISLPDGLNIDEYDEIYVNDAASTLMLYLYSRGKKFIWVEHAKNALAVKMPFAYNISFHVMKILDWLGITCSLRGSSRLVEAVEVTNKENVMPLIRTKRMIEIDIDQIINGMTAEMKSKIFGLYERAYDMKFDKKKPLNIVCTNPFYRDGHVKTKKEAEKIIRNIIRNKIGDCVNLIIKPHPRDDIDYKNIFPYAVVCEKCVSVEIFDLAPYDIGCVYIFEKSSVESFKNAKRTVRYKCDCVS